MMLPEQNTRKHAEKGPDTALYTDELSACARTVLKELKKQEIRELIRNLSENSIPGLEDTEIEEFYDSEEEQLDTSRSGDHTTLFF